MVRSIIFQINLNKNVFVVYLPFLLRDNLRINKLDPRKVCYDICDTIAPAIIITDTRKGVLSPGVYLLIRGGRCDSWQNPVTTIL